MDVLAKWQADWRESTSRGRSPAPSALSGEDDSRSPRGRSPRRPEARPTEETPADSSKKKGKKKKKGGQNAEKQPLAETLQAVAQ
eukprot:5180253-Alexandrium_andersonii.AAC.1